MTGEPVKMSALMKQLEKLLECPVPEGTEAVTPGQRKVLESQGCRSGSWSEVEISGKTDLSLIANCVFSGRVRMHLPSGEISRAALCDIDIIGPLTIRNTGLVQGYTLLEGSSIENCGSVVFRGIPGFFTAAIQGGLETGERSLRLYPLLDHEKAAFLASGQGRGQADVYRQVMEDASNGTKGVIGKNCCISNCPVVFETLMLSGSSISGATAVEGSLIFPGASVAGGALVRSSVLQWNSVTDSLALVENSILGELAKVQRHGMLKSSFLGAGSVLCQGEVNSSVVGPLCGIHHQSLLIAALWPGGKGNVGYGANIGSNHTSRLPDQEVRPGAGFFFGLGTSVKFPSDFSRSPYTVIATGMTTLPQKVEFPFSLLTPPEKRPEGVPEGWGRLIPGWMLHSNLYSVLRNEWKYRQRLRAVHTAVETAVFTPGVLRMVADARERLARPDGHTVPGAGKNFVTREDRLAGAEAYRKCLRFHELLDILSNSRLDPGQACELTDLLQQIRSAVRQSRMKDWIRGNRIIPDYAAVHPSPESDPFLSEIDRVIGELENSVNTKA